MRIRLLTKHEESRRCMLVELIGGDRGEVDAERKDVGTVLRRLKVEAAREEAHLMKEAIRRNERPSVVMSGHPW